MGNNSESKPKKHANFYIQDRPDEISKKIIAILR